MQKTGLVFVSAFLLASVHIAASDVINFGRCPSGITTVQNFNAAGYVGKWHEYAKYPVSFESDARCITAQYAALGGDKVSVLNTQISPSNKTESIEGEATIIGSGKLSVRFPSLPFFVGAADYWILATDYDKYAVVYSCRHIFFNKIQFVWILTRDAKPSKLVVYNAMSALVKQNISLEPLTLTDQSNCPLS